MFGKIIKTFEKLMEISCTNFLRKILIMFDKNIAWKAI